MSNSDPPAASGPSLGQSSTQLLARIEERLARLEARTDWMEKAEVMTPRVLGTAGDIFDTFAERHELSARIDGAGQLLEQLTRPGTLEQLNEALRVAQQLPKVAATLADTFDAYADEAEQLGVELDSLAPRLGKLSTRVATALQSADRAEPAPKGLFALLRELKDPAVRQAMGFALAFAKEFGQSETHEHAALEGPRS